MTLTRRRNFAAVAILAAIAVALAGTAAADENTPESSWQLRGKVRAGGSSSDARALPGTVDLLHQAACREAQDLLADGEPGRIKVEMAVWRQSGPEDATSAKVPNVDCDQRLERESAFRTTARVLYPREGGEPARTGSLTLGGAVELAARAANQAAPSVLETGREASIVVVAAHDEKTVRQMIRSLAVRYGLDPGTAIRIAECESGLNPRAYSPPYAGIFQHDENRWSRRAATYGHAGESIFDPYANIDVALQMARSSGWGHWGCA